MDPAACRRVLEVNTRFDNQPNNAVCLPGGDCSIRAAINTANICEGGQIINLQPDVFYPLIHLHEITEADPSDYKGHIALPPIRSNIEIRGNGATISVAYTSARHFYVTPLGQLSISNLTLPDGKVGGYTLSWSSPLSDIAFKYNHGGAILNEGSMTATSVQFIRNRAAVGGAVMNYGEGRIESGSRLIENIAWHCSGVANEGRLVISYAHFLRNSSPRASAVPIGGNIANSDSTTWAT